MSHCCHDCCRTVIVCLFVGSGCRRCHSVCSCLMTIAGIMLIGSHVVVTSVVAIVAALLNWLQVGLHG